MPANAPSTDLPGEEAPTAPELPHYKCPECRGIGYRPCNVCKGERLITRHQLEAWRVACLKGLK